MASKTLVTCNCCSGKGVKELPNKLREFFHTLKKNEPATISAVSKKCGVELTAAHHRMSRLVELGVVKRVRGSSPAEYSSSQC